ncbi:MAG: hypothetical protein QOE55_5496 [Acidobacteriaceae bacterium]|nr:hypothetical protein [Acidobacteriaceae bacterium]
MSLAGRIVRSGVFRWCAAGSHRNHRAISRVPVYRIQYPYRRFFQASSSPMGGQAVVSDLDACGDLPDTVDIP